MFRSSFARSIVPTLSQVVRQPGWIATALSVGIHGILWGVLPILPSSFLAEEADDQRTVGVVELSPEELTRVPDFSTPSLELPPLAESDLYSLSPVPNQSPPSQLFPPLPPFSPDLYPPYEPPPGAPTTRQAPSPAPAAPSPSRSPSPSAAPSPSPTPGTVAPTNPGVARNQELDNLTGRAGTAPSPAPEDNSSSQDNRTVEQRLQATIAQRRTALNRIGRNAAGTTSEEANLAFGDWFYNQLERDEGDFEPVEIPAAFPQEACPLEIETDAIYGVVINPENDVVDEPKLIRSSGYQLFNQKALEAITAHEFENESDDDQVYLVTVKFDHTAEACQAPAPSAPSNDSPPAG